MTCPHKFNLLSRYLRKPEAPLCPSYVFVPDLDVSLRVSTLASSSRCNGLPQSVFLWAPLYPTLLSLVALLVRSLFCRASPSVSLASFFHIILRCFSYNFSNLVPLCDPRFYTMFLFNTRSEVFDMICLPYYMHVLQPLRPQIVTIPFIE